MTPKPQLSLNPLRILQRALIKHWMLPAQVMKASQFEEFQLRGGEVVFLGDSITEGGQWNEWFPDLPTVNRGIGGDTSAGVLARLDTAVSGPPSVIVVLIGTNDFGMGVPIGSIADNVDDIIAALQEAAPDARIVLQSVMPRSVKLKDRIGDLNDRYRQIAYARRVQFIDLWPALADSTGSLRREFTADGLHLNGAGYRAWVAVLRSALDALSPRPASSAAGNESG